jgi:hypothetical protein
MKFFFICVIAIFAVSCSQKKVENSLIFYQDYPETRIWIYNKEIEFKLMHHNDTRREYIRIAFDTATQKLWAFQSSKDFTNLYFMCIFNGEKNQEVKIEFEFSASIQHVFIYNNVALCVYNSGLCRLVDLTTTENVELVLSTMEKKDYGYGFIGFNGENIFFRDEYYNINDCKYQKYKQVLRYPRYNPLENKIIGINIKDEVVIYDPKKNSSITTAIRIRLNDSLYHDGDDLFFMDDNRIYFSKDTLNFKNLFVFLKRPAYRTWYRYNEGRRDKIYTPTGYVKILGRVP